MTDKEKLDAATEEIWKPVVGYEDYYEVSSTGRVKSKDRNVNTRNGSKAVRMGRVLVQRTRKDGYKVVYLSVNGKSKTAYVHRILFQAFSDDFNEGLQVNHINSNRADNRIENLELVTARENATHGKRKTKKLLGAFYVDRRKMWHSQISLNGKTKTLGYFKTEREAHEAYKNALLKYGLVNKYAE